MQAIPQHRTVFSRAEPFTGRGAERQSSQRATEPSTHDFLSRRFLPLCSVDESIMPNGRNIERDFFSSLSNLAKAYHFEPVDRADKAYPYNVLLAHWHASLKIENANPHTKLLIVQKKNKTVLATKTVFDTGSTLFYIPVVPLHRLLTHTDTQPCAALILSVCAYLYQIVKIPFYRDQSSYLYWLYQMIEEWLTEEPEGWEQSEFLENMKELEEAAQIGESIKTLIVRKKHLKGFEKRLQGFIPSGDFENRCYAMANEAYGLFLRYPKRTVFDKMEDFGRENDSEECYIRPQQYISFIADSSGWLFEQMTEMVNNDFNECSTIQEPVIWTIYDGATTTDLTDGLNFEKRLFALIRNVCNLLNEIP
ncbi:hypothetical protein [Dyadobacter frigoris]|uniref:Uncharacterized protein n=1 Tax=Dyadobacter frigoris TaxID=2576211 RepID=A0A4U6CRI3_9BACT|nr:hypothetical protein [Dyadobacter frigoris]TKT85478.1 hypothetical protein FDK13_33725 [Dyadobacter frigoris]GLU56245.1 hypothetical protein Dfri01_57060 [Dyadobacter frigoris]